MTIVLEFPSVDAGQGWLIFVAPATRKLAAAIKMPTAAYEPRHPSNETIRNREAPSWGRT